ncbi:hypothetical protein FQA39_LY13434 [Lamprigera yunnana]|nr:hypothetical protein FQA39_LY13434 [Lamprigera yunnana]
MSSPAKRILVLAQENNKERAEIASETNSDREDDYLVSYSSNDSVKDKEYAQYLLIVIKTVTNALTLFLIPFSDCAQLTIQYCCRSSQGMITLYDVAPQTFHDATSWYRYIVKPQNFQSLIIFLSRINNDLSL